MIDSIIGDETELIEEAGTQLQEVRFLINLRAEGSADTLEAMVDLAVKEQEDVETQPAPCGLGSIHRAGCRNVVPAIRRFSQQGSSRYFQTISYMCHYRQQ